MKLGILGDGQLGRMLAAAAHDLGVEPAVYGPGGTSARALIPDAVQAPFEDLDALARFRDRVDVLTPEMEHLPADAVTCAAATGTFTPSADALRAGRDRLLEKKALVGAGLPLARFAPVDTEADLAAAVRGIGRPCLLKRRVSGYDGKGQAWIRDDPDLQTAWAAVGAVPSVLEAEVRFTREVSLIAVRGRDGAMVWYPPVLNRHKDGILRESRVPVDDLDPRALHAIREGLARWMSSLRYVGVLVTELFDAPEGWLINEIAPRVHNSGHWTIEGAETSQFENHVRAVAGLPLGSTALRGPAAMVNLIGTVPPVADLLRVEGARLHLYGKSPRPGRKLGHVTITAPDADTLDRRLEAVRRVVG